MTTRKRIYLSVISLSILLESATYSLKTVAHGVGLEEVVVHGRSINLIGDADTASEGVVGQSEIGLRPISRSGDILEFVPGMIATQHSGSGKANQYFLRGFNLDHGTDFSTTVDGMPVNMPTHGHGHGYNDLNFLIPETIYQLNYNKGPYDPKLGDFSSAGAAKITTNNAFAPKFAELALGQDRFSRLLFINTAKLLESETYYAIEHQRYDGPWSDISEDVKKTNLLVKHDFDISNGHLSLGLMYYDNQWNSADQIPRRAVTSGQIDELGSIDKSLGGDSHRYSVNAAIKYNDWHASFYAISYGLNLWSNFTYFLDSVNEGDQFEQVDDRKIYGGQYKYYLLSQLGKKSSRNTFGVDIRIDDIDEVGLYRSQARTRLGSVRSDAVKQQHLSAFLENRIKWSERLISVFSTRYDHFDFDVKNKINTNINNIDLAANSGNASDGNITLKGSLIYTLSPKWESYVSIGEGFHSNDARGTTINISPEDGSPIDKVNPIVESLGYEVGARGFIAERLNISLALWALELDSELLFVGDAGTTEASEASERQGLELTSYITLSNEWSLDLEYAFTDAKYANGDSDNKIPGTIRDGFQAGLNMRLENNWHGSLRFRYFGKRPLIEDGSTYSKSSRIMNFRLGYTGDTWSYGLDILNLANSDDHDIDYLYESRLANEPVGAGTEDLHYHVFEPRTLRLSLRYTL